MKRNIIYISALALAASITLTSCSAAAGANESVGSTDFFAMDTYMDVTAYGDRGQSAADRLHEYICELEAGISRTCETSDVYRLNHDPEAAVPVSEDLLTLLSLSKEYSELLNGVFDVTITCVEDLWGFASDSFRVPADDEITQALEHVGMEHVHWDEHRVWLDPGAKIDFGGIAKGYAADQALTILNDHEIEHGLVNLGGDLLAKGGKPDGAPWRIAIQDPASGQDQSKYIGVVELQDGYMLTSGNYQRYFQEDGSTYHHIIDPRTGRPSQSGLDSVTVISSLGGCSGALCDALATSLFIMGADDALDFWRSSGLDFDLVLITEDGKVLATDGLQDCFIPNAGAPYQFTFVS